MNDWTTILGAFAVFLLGLRLSAFCSGSETGFYRLSVPRITIDAKAGDTRAKKILWFVHHPTQLVATCLIGNNVANYLCTAAISAGLIALLGTVSETVEIASTLIMTPVIFQFAELLPKTLFYLSPYSGIRKNIRFLNFLYVIFLPITWPMVHLTRFFEHWSQEKQNTGEFLSGRSRIADLVHQGKNEGVLTEIQSRLANGLLQLAPQSIHMSMIPISRVLAMSDSQLNGNPTSVRAELLNFANKYAIRSIPIYRGQTESEIYAYVSASQIALGQTPQKALHVIPVLTPTTSKLEALHDLQINNSDYGLVKKNNSTIGLISRNGLVEQIFRPDVNNKVIASI